MPESSVTRTDHLSGDSFKTFDNGAGGALSQGVTATDSGGTYLPLSTEAKQDAQITELQNIIVKMAADPSTEAKQDVVIAGLASLLAELELKADADETQDVNVVGGGDASAANQATMITSLGDLLTELQVKADPGQAQLVSLPGVRIEEGHGSSGGDPTFVNVVNAPDINILSPTNVHQDKGGFVEGVSNMGGVGGVVNDTATSDVAEDTFAVFRITPKRGIHTNLRDNDGVEYGAGNPFPVLSTEADVVAIDANNSASGTLVTLATPFTGTATDLLADGGYQSITVNIVQTTAGEEGTMFFEFSQDGTTWPVSIPTDLTGLAFVLPLPLATVMRYFRIRVTAAVSFTIDLQTLLHRTSPIDLTQLPHQPMVYSTPLKNVRSLLHARRLRGGIADSANNNEYGNLEANEAGNLLMANHDVELAKGNIVGSSNAEVNGNVFFSSAGSSGDVWAPGTLYTGQPTTGLSQPVGVISSSALDTAAGTGMQTIRIVGLKTPGSTIIETEDIATNGNIIQAVSSESWWRVFDAFGVGYGAGATNAGTITIRHSVATGNVFAEISPGVGRDKTAVFTIPAGCDGYLSRIRFGMSRTNGSAGSATVELRVRRDGIGGYNAVFREEITDSSAYLYQGGRVFPELTDLKVRVADTSDTNSTISADMRLELVKRS